MDWPQTQMRLRPSQRCPPPADVKALKRLLGMVNYLEKLIPHLSTICKPLRQLEHQDVECWLEKHNKAFEHVKSLITVAPVLAYYGLTPCNDTVRRVRRQIRRNPIAGWKASRVLTQAECNYTQIKKELLAIVYACEKFDQYVYARSDQCGAT